MAEWPQPVVSLTREPRVVGDANRGPSARLEGSAMENELSVYSELESFLKKRNLFHRISYL
jgi:hypothetical protein